MFVGRSGEFERLSQMLRGEPGGATAAVVTGDAGIGKTRLLAEVIQATPDVLVLAGGCLPLSESLPYGAVTDALTVLTRASIRPVLDRALSRCPPFVHGQMAALVPALSGQASAPSGGAADRARMFAAVRELLVALGAEGRTALVIEDLHWADSGTLDLLTFLLSGQATGIALVVTSRRDELGAENAALDWLGTASRLPAVERIALDPLSKDNVEALVMALVATEPGGTFVADVVRRGEGNPFFTEQLVAAAKDVASPPAALPGVPPEVAAMLLGRIRSVGRDATEVASALAVAARALAEPELAPCVDESVDVAAGLRDLLDAHLVETAEYDRYRLRHALLEDAVRTTLLASQQQLLHSRVGHVLARRGDTPPVEMAAHWRGAGDAVEEARWSMAAARHAESVFAWREASLAWRRAWDLYRAMPAAEDSPVHVREAAVACVANARRADDDAVFLDVAQRALHDDVVTSDAQATAMVLRLYGYRLTLTDVSAGIAAQQRAVSLFESVGAPSSEWAHTLMFLVTSKTWNRATTGTEDAELARAAAIAAEVGDPEVLLELAADRAMDLIGAGRVQEGLSRMAEIAQRRDEGGVGTAPLFAYVGLTDTYLWTLRLSEGIATGDRGLAWALETGHREEYWFSLLAANLVDCLLLAGNVEEARRQVNAYQLPDLTEAGWPLYLLRAELDLRDGDPASSVRLTEKLAGSEVQQR